MYILQILLVVEKYKIAFKMIRLIKISKGKLLFITRSFFRFVDKQDVWILERFFQRLTTERSFCCKEGTLKMKSSLRLDIEFYY